MDDSEPVDPEPPLQSFDQTLFPPAKAAACRRTKPLFSVVPKITIAVNCDAIDSIDTSGDRCHHTPKGSPENRFH